MATACSRWSMRSRASQPRRRNRRSRRQRPRKTPDHSTARQPMLSGAAVNRKSKPHVRALTHLDRLEAESIQILRETVAEADKPVMLYSIGKDSAVMLHLARKAFFPGPLPFPLMHVDTTWKFRDMYALRDKVAADHRLIVWKNAEAERQGINPFDHGPRHTDLWKTEGLKQALEHHGFDA